MMRAPMHRRIAGVWVFLAAVAGSVCSAAPRIVYCDARATGRNDGTSWQNAYLCLQDALSHAGTGTEIRVAQGTYRPDRRAEAGQSGIEVVASGSRSDSFLLRSGIAVRGGYVGYGAPDPDRRDIEACPSILSGDLAGNDAALNGHDWQSIFDFIGDQSRMENSYSVVAADHADGSAVLDGFIITGGHANGRLGVGPRSYFYGWPDTDGAGAFVEGGNPTFVRCTFRRNSTRSAENTNTGGAAVVVQAGSPTFTDCLFQENVVFGSGVISYGGAIVNLRSSPVLQDCTFADNFAAGFDGQYWGGAIANITSSPVIRSCTFRRNAALRSKGGAVFNGETSNPTLADCTFERGLADAGGAIYNSDGSSPVLTRCLFLENQAVGYGRGGAIFNGSNGRMVAAECLFIGNVAAQEGGALCGSGMPRLVNCLFAGNRALKGGAAFVEWSGTATFINCTLAANQADDNGGALYGQQSTTTFTNCILWGDTPEEIYLENGTANAGYSDVQGGWAGPGNIDRAPRFLNAAGTDGVTGTADDDLRLTMGSPCLDAGDGATLSPATTADLDGKTRIANGRVDMGAYEFNGPFNYYVDAANGSDANGGWSPQEAFATIQKGIDTAQQGYAVLVLPGRYTEGIDFKGKAITVAGMDSAPTLEAPGDYAVSFYSAEGLDSVLKNFVITNSKVGIFIAGSSPTICNVTLAGNEFGIAAYSGANPEVTNCIFWNNTDGDLFGCKAKFSCLEPPVDGEGNISSNPLFADAEGGDYHLLSRRGRYVAAYRLWSFDPVTSPCIDAGDPAMSVGPERAPNGGRIDMGAYGGTSEASLSDSPLAADLNGDRTVDFHDLAVLARQWLAEAPAAEPASLLGPQPDPARWASDGLPTEVYGGGGFADYYAQMKAVPAVSQVGPVQYYFEARGYESVYPDGFSSGWIDEPIWQVRVGRQAQAIQFRVRARDQYGNKTAWSPWEAAIGR